MARDLRSWVLAAATAMTTALFSVPAHGTSGALELVRSARAHEQAHEDDLALRRYMEALSLDVTCSEAYLGLGALRARRGDLREAERVYSVALEHVPTLREARLARAHLRRQLGAHAEAMEDVRASTDDDVAALRILAGWHAEDGQVPAQLAVWRQIAARAESVHDTALIREARTMVRALEILAGPADPVSSPQAGERSELRRTLALLRRKG